MINRILITIAAAGLSVAASACQSDMSGNVSRNQVHQDASDIAQNGTKTGEYNKSNGYGFRNVMLNEGEADENDAIREDPGIQDIGK